MGTRNKTVTQAQDAPAQAETSPRSGTQAVAEKAGNTPTDPATDQPKAKIAFKDALQFFAAAASVHVHATMKFVVSGAVAYIIGSLSGMTKREDCEKHLAGLVAEVRVKKSQRYAMLDVSFRLASKIMATGKAALPNSVALRNMILTADTAEAACTAVLAELAATNKAASFNTLKITCSMENPWTKQDQEKADKAATPQGRANRKRKAERERDKSAVDRAQLRPEIAERAIVQLITTNEKRADGLAAIMAGINTLGDRDAILSIRKACDDRLAVLAKPQPQAPAKGEATQPEQAAA